MNSKRLFLTLLLLTVANAQLLAQTNVPSSIISQDINWSLSGSPYTINGNLIIDNAKLSVEPGVKIIFNSDYSIRIRANGTIYARGTELDSIRITSTEQVHSGRFIFEDISSSTVTENDTLFLSGSIFSFVKFDKLGLVGGYWRNSYWESYNGNFRGNVKLLFDHCSFTNLISGQYNDPRQYSYDLISHINETIFNHCEFSKLKLGWGLIGNRTRSKVSIYNSTFSQITKNGYGPLFIQNPFTKIINSHFSEIQTNKFFAGFYTDHGDSLVVKNSSFKNITCFDQFQYLNHPVVEFEKVLFQNISSPEFVRKEGLNEAYTVSNSSFDQLSIENYLFTSVKLTIRNSNFNLNAGQKISNAAESPNPMATGFLGNNYWRINNQVISDTTYLHGLSVDYYNDVTRDKIVFNPLNGSPELDAPPISKFSQAIDFQALSDRTYGDAPFDLNASASSGLPISYTSSDSNVATISGNKVTVVGAGTVTISAAQEGNDEIAAADTVKQVLTINKASLTASADDEIRIYGDANPTFSIDYSGFKNNETSSVINSAPTVSSSAVATSQVGNYPITVSGGTDNNYTFIYLPGTLTVNKAPLTITAENKTRVYGEANPGFTLAYAGFKNEETSTVIDSAPAVSTTASPTSDTGTYPITITGGTDNNYNFSYVPGILTITKANQTITFEKPGDVSESAGSFLIAATSSSNLTIALESLDQAKLTISGNTATIIGPGQATVRAIQAGNNNYEPATDVTQTFCILPRKPEITASGLGTENVTLTSSAKSNIQWYKDGQLLSDQTDADLQVDGSGLYKVRCTVEGCFTESEELSLIITGMDKEYSDGIDLYPNPVRDELKLVVPDFNSEACYGVKLIDQSGRTVATQQLSGKETRIRVDGLAPGRYFVLVLGIKRLVYKSFVKQ